MPRKRDAELDPVGLLGLGLMGRGIAACLLANGFRVTAYNRTARRASAAVEHIDATLRELVRRKLIPRSRFASWRDRLTAVRTPAGLADCPFIIETVKEDLDLKRRLYDRVERAVADDAIIASNTSAIPVGDLQEGRAHPDRFVVMHWAEPAAVTRYLEIVPGRQTSARAVALAHRLGLACGKEPTILNFDIRGFISNRLMYAMMREACHLVESGVADVETVDRSFRNDIGWWAALAGPFRWMDLTGIPAYAAVMEGLFPELCNSDRLPALMKNMAASGAKGAANRKGFYPYTPATAAAWEQAWLDFTFDLRKLVEKYGKRLPE